jgi:hypothetical protein
LRSFALVLGVVVLRLVVPVLTAVRRERNVLLPLDLLGAIPNGVL